MVSIINEPKGISYFRLLEYLLKTCDKFSLTIRDGLWKDYSAYSFLESLESYLIDIIIGEDFSFNNYCDGKVYIYRLTKESLEILKGSSQGLYDWQHPGLPEDLSFFDKDWYGKLISVAHEGIGSFDIADEDELIWVRDYIGLEVCL